MPKAVLRVLKERTLVVCLEATSEVRETLFKKYLSNPKQVIW